MGFHRAPLKPMDCHSNLHNKRKRKMENTAPFPSTMKKALPQSNSFPPPLPKKPSKIHYPFHVIPIALIVVFLVVVVILYGEGLEGVFLQNPFSRGDNWEEAKDGDGEKKKLPFAVGWGSDGCDVFSGKWVYDEAERPFYQEEDCPYIQPQLTCQKEGRPDKGYQHWRWKPHGCSLPRFNASLMLESLRGKRMLFVGDSLNRGQFVSMVCLLHRVIPKEGKSMKTLDSLTVFSAKGYNMTIEFNWAPFLLESNSDNAIVHRVTDRIVRAESIEKHAKHWQGADIIVFNTYLWWMTGKKMKILHGPFSGNMKNIELKETADAYRLAMKSMVKWVEENLDPRKTRVFFTSMSPFHEKSKEWGGAREGNCYNETKPIEGGHYWRSESNRGIMQVMEEELTAAAKIPITVLNITHLSEYRKDAHTSIYKKQWNELKPEQLANPMSYADCVHWCLPGLQDTWNELLYYNLFFPKKPS